MFLRYTRSGGDGVIWLMVYAYLSYLLNKLVGRRDFVRITPPPLLKDKDNVEIKAFNTDYGTMFILETRFGRYVVNPRHLADFNPRARGHGDVVYIAPTNILMSDKLKEDIQNFLQMLESQSQG